MRSCEERAIWESEVQRVNLIVCVIRPDEVRGECNVVER